MKTIYCVAPRCMPDGILAYTRLWSVGIKGTNKAVAICGPVEGEGSIQSLADAKNIAALLNAQPVCLPLKWNTWIDGCTTELEAYATQHQILAVDKYNTCHMLTFASGFWFEGTEQVLNIEDMRGWIAMPEIEASSII